MAKNLVIKTTMDNKDFDSKYSDLVKQLEVAESKLNNSKDALNTYQKELQDVSRQYEILGEEAEKTFQRIVELEDKMNDPYKNISSTEYLEYEELVKSYEKMNKELSRMEIQQDSLTNKVSKTNTQVQQEELAVSKVNNKITELKDNANNINVSGMSNGIEKLIKKVSKWGLALIGIRSAYSAIRMSINQMTQYDEQLKADMEYLQYGLAMTLKPLVEALVPLIFQVLNAINQVVYSITGINLFANSMADGFKSASNSAKELKKTLAGFDTATILNDNGSGTGGVNTGVATKYNLGEVDDSSLLPSLTKTFTKIQTTVYGFFKKIKENILSLIVGTDWYTPVSLIIDGLGNIIDGLGGIVGDLLSLIIGLCTGDMGLIEQTFESFIGHIIQVLKGAGQIAWGIIINVFTMMKKLLGAALKVFYSLFIEPIVKLFQLLGNTIKSVFNGIATYIATTWNKIKISSINMGYAIGNAISGAIKSVVNWIINQVESKVNSVIRGINSMTSVINKIPGVNIGRVSTLSLPRLASGGIVNNPGRGVPIGGAIAGESGREGVLPLTDSQAMAQLGREIGQWISVNVDLTTKLDGRVLSRSLERVKDNNSFVRNGV